MKLTRRNLLVSGLVLAALIVGSWVVKLFPDAASLFEQPFDHPAPMGKLVELRTIKAKVVGLTVAQTVTDGAGKTFTTKGKFVIVRIEATVKHKAQPLPAGELKDDKGRLFTARRGISSPCGTGQPGITRACETVFEVAKDADNPVFRYPTQYYEDQDDVLVVPIGTLPKPVAHESLKRAATIGALR